MTLRLWALFVCNTQHKQPQQYFHYAEIGVLFIVMLECDYAESRGADCNHFIFSQLFRFKKQTT